MGEGAKRTRVMLRTLKDSLLAPDRDEAARTGWLRFKSHIAKLCHEKRLPLPQKDDTGRRSGSGKYRPIDAPSGNYPVPPIAVQKWFGEVE